MTAKEKLLERVTRLSETEAEETLRLLDDPDDPVVAAETKAGGPGTPIPRRQRAPR